MNCTSCGHVLPQPVSPTERFVECADCGTKNDLAGNVQNTLVENTLRLPSRRALMADLVGRTLGNGMYRIDSVIGGGGMAKVYCATQLRLDRKVAVKVLPQELTNDPSFVLRFQREATVLAKFSHANIVPVFDTGEEEGIHYIVMGYIEGPAGKASTLRELLDDKPLEIEHAVRIMKQCLSALQYAHEMSIIHRDIKPGNILIDANGDAHLADFGIASSRGTVGDATLTVTGSTLGTARYMAPEQTESAGRADARSDLYSLGLVFYEMLVGYIPEAKTILPGDLLTSKKQSKQFVLPSIFKPGQIDERLDQIILRAIQPDPADRFQNAAEMLLALTEAVGGDIDGGTVGLPRRRPKKRGRNRILLLATGVLILVVAGGGWQYYRVARTRIPTALLEAMKGGNEDAVIEMLQKQPDLLDRSDVDGSTPLHLAAADGLPKVVAKMLEVKPNSFLDMRNSEGRTALHEAARKGHATVIVLLMDAHARNDLRDYNGKNPEELAVEQKHEDAKLVFRHAAFRQAIDDDDRIAIATEVRGNPRLSSIVSGEGWGILHYAAYKGNAATVDLLLRNGADPDGTVKRRQEVGDSHLEPGSTPLILAAEFNTRRPDVVARLLQATAGPDGSHTAAALPNLCDAQGWTALHYAAKNGSIAIANSLIAANANVDAKTTDTRQWTPLHAAAQAGKTEMVSLLLAKGANQHARDAKNATAIELAAAEGQSQVVGLLLKGTDDSMRKAASDAAGSAGHGDIVRSVDTWWKQQIFEPLKASVGQAEQVTGVRKMLDAHPDQHLAATTRPEDGKTPLGVALETDRLNMDLVALLVRAEPALVAAADNNGETPLSQAARKGNISATRVLLDANPAVNIDRIGPSLLNAAVAGGSVEVVDLLVERKQLDVNGIDAKKQTPLQVAAERCDSAMISELLKLNAVPDMEALAKVTRRPSLGDPARAMEAARLIATPLLLRVAASANPPPNSEVIALALKSNADLAAVNGSGKTALQVAAAAGNAEVVKAILSSPALPPAVCVAARKSAADAPHHEIVSLIDEWWSSAIFAAVARGNADELSALLQNRMAQGPIVRPGDSRTALAVALGASPPNIKVIRVLLQAKAGSLEDLDAKGYTPLRVAAQEHDSAKIGTLLDLGALPDLKALQDIQVTSPLADRAKAAGPIAMSLLLSRVQDGMGNDVAAVLDSAKTCNVTEAELLGCTNAQGQTPLQLAAAKKAQIDVVRLLLDKGAAADQKNAKTGDTALHVAAHEGCDEIVSELLKHGADFNIGNRQGFTPMKVAEQAQQAKSVKILQEAADPCTWFKRIRDNNLRLSLTGVANIDFNKGGGRAGPHIGDTPLGECWCSPEGVLTITLGGAAPLPNLGDGIVKHHKWTEEIRTHNPPRFEKIGKFPIPIPQPDTITYVEHDEVVGHTYHGQLVRKADDTCVWQVGGISVGASISKNPNTKDGG